MDSRIPEIYRRAQHKPAAPLETPYAFAVGLCLHLSWLLCALFSFSMPGVGASTQPPAAQAITVAFVAGALLIAVFDSKRFPAAENPHMQMCCAVIVGIATASIMLVGGAKSAPLAFSIPLGICAGAAYAALTVMWGSAFSCKSSRALALFAAQAIAGAVAVSVLVLLVLPAFASLVVSTCLVPAATAIALRHRPRLCAQRRSLPLFAPLTVAKVKLGIVVGIPTALIGFVMGCVYNYPITRVSTGMGWATIVLLAAVIALLLFLGALIGSKSSKPNALFRPILIPLCLILALIGFVQVDNGFMLTMYLTVCFLLAMLSWATFGDLNQRYRLSAEQVYGFGFACLVIFAYAGSICAPLIANMLAQFPALRFLFSFLMVMVMITAYVLLPDGSTVQHMVGYENLISLLTQTKRTALAHADTTHQAENNSFATFYRHCIRVADYFLLSQGETEVLFFLAGNYDVDAVEQRLNLSSDAALTTIRCIFRKTGCHDRNDLTTLVDNADGLPANKSAWNALYFENWLSISVDYMNWSTGLFNHKK